MLRPPTVAIFQGEHVKRVLQIVGRWITYMWYHSTDN